MNVVLSSASEAELVKLIDPIPSTFIVYEPEAMTIGELVN